MRREHEGWRELLVVLFASAAAAVALTWPLAPGLGRIARDDGDGRFSIWNVAWVAHALTTDPAHVFDANIFFPHTGTLAYSENNLGAGALAVPVWVATGNPYAAHNFVVLLAFVLAATGMYYLVRRLTNDRRAAAVSAIGFAFCPYVFAHMAHIQLLMTAGLPFAMLAFHRLADCPTLKHGAVLGGVMAAQALSCGYYGIFVALAVGYGVIVVCMSRGFWANRRFAFALVVGGLVSIALVVPAFAHYLALERVGFTRDLDAARFYSPNLSAYLASSSYAHAWMLERIPPWKNEVAFPGFVVGLCGVAGAWIAWTTRRRELLAIYGGLTALAAWASFGPAAGLYTLLYRTIPVFSLLRAPGRFVLVVAFGLAVLAGVAIAEVLARVRHATAAACVLALVTAGELLVPLRLPEAAPVEPVYRVLATLPRQGVIEMPFYYHAVGLFQHTKYMVASTAHWMPLVNGYSDYIPPDFHEDVETLKFFPSREAFKVLERKGARYAVVHLYGYNDENRRDVLARLQEFAQYLRPLYQDDATRLYEIVGFPP